VILASVFFGSGLQFAAQEYHLILKALNDSISLIIGPTVDRRSPTVDQPSVLIREKRSIARRVSL
jgi:hypothetical protein